MTSAPEQDGQQRHRHEAGVEADDQGDAAGDLGQNDRPGEDLRQADLAQEIRQSPAS